MTLPSVGGKGEYSEEWYLARIHDDGLEIVGLRGVLAEQSRQLAELRAALKTVADLPICEGPVSASDCCGYLNDAIDEARRALESSRTEGT